MITSFLRFACSNLRRQKCLKHGKNPPQTSILILSSNLASPSHCCSNSCEICRACVFLLSVPSCTSLTGRSASHLRVWIESAIRASLKKVRIGRRKQRNSSVSKEKHRFQRPILLAQTVYGDATKVESTHLGKGAHLLLPRP